jgi:diguanylate cyclase (GGDEF)-like protein
VRALTVASNSEQVTLELHHKTYYEAVATVSRLDLSTFPDSPYAAELQADSSHLRFSPPLEAQYQRDRLLSSRMLVRVACTFAIAMTIMRGFEQVYEKVADLAFLIELAMVIASSIALGVIAWSPAFERLYPYWARILVPLRNSLMSVQIAGSATHGQPEMLMALPIVLIGGFFFLGLPFRSTLFCCAASLVAYVAAATAFNLSPVVALHTYGLLLGGVAGCVIAVWHIEKISRRSFLESHLIAELAQRDPLTGTKNRRVFDEHLELLWQQAVVNERSLAILLIDIDHFKAYNDFYGHQAGDRALRQVAQTIQKSVRRPLDILTRYGGEEFAAVLYDVDGEQAKEIGERIRVTIGELNIEHRASRPFSRVTISIGVAAIVPTTQRSPSGAVQLADQALYAAKVQGRNRVELMDSREHDLLETGVFAIGAAVSHKLSAIHSLAPSSGTRPAQNRRESAG